jgi:hypothetical protein
VTAKNNEGDKNFRPRRKKPFCHVFIVLIFRVKRRKFISAGYLSVRNSARRREHTNPRFCHIATKSIRKKACLGFNLEREIPVISLTCAVSFSSSILPIPTQSWNATIMKPSLVHSLSSFITGQAEMRSSKKLQPIDDSK